MKKKVSILGLVLICMLALVACKNDEEDVEYVTFGTARPTTPVERTQFERDGKDFYKPAEFKAIDFTSSKSQWCFKRSRQSENFIVFWEKGFGDDPNSNKNTMSMRVDVDDLLAKAEQFFKYYKETMKFMFDGDKGSWTDEYKMEIYIYYQKDWLATGCGYDNKIGAIWINPSTCQPAGQTIAHEIGHAFQYQIYCDQLKNGEVDNLQTGFMYRYENCSGNGFWEQCAQWMSYQLYPKDFFTWSNMPIWFDNCHRAYEDEWMRYQSYWLQEYLIKKYNDVTLISKMWKLNRYPKDALQTYMDVNLNNDFGKLKDEMYDYAAHMATFDIDGLRDNAKEYLNKYKTNLLDVGDGYKQVTYDKCPGEFGFNVINCDIPANGVIKVDFKGLPIGSVLPTGDPGIAYKGADKETKVNVTAYNNSEAVPGWRYGFVAMLEDGSRVYGDMNSSEDKTISFKVPANTKSLYLVVMGCAKDYWIHTWDNNELNDLQMPYKIKFL